MVFILVSISPDIADFFEDIITDIFGRSAGRSLGKILAIIPFGIIYGCIHFTYGRDSNYNATIAEFDTFNDEKQKLISKSSMKYFIASIVLFAISLSLFLII